MDMRPANEEGEMPRKVMVVTTAWGANGVTAGLAAEAIKERNLQTALGLLDEAAALRPDVVCLPEELLIIGVPREHRRALLEPVRGPAFAALAERARRHGTELVVWPSAYDGGFPLQAYAWRNQYYVVSSVWTSFGRVIDITGRVLGQTTRSVRLVAQQIDLEKRLFHTDYNLGKIALIRQKLGRS